MLRRCSLGRWAALRELARQADRLVGGPDACLVTDGTALPKKGKLSVRFTALRVRVGDGPVWGNNRHLPGAEAQLVGEWRSSGERKYYLSNLPPETSRRSLAGTIKARWIGEQTYQQFKEELGVDHFEGSLGQACIDTRR